MTKKEISLLPEKKLIRGMGDKLLNWILSVGRYIVVFTELIVILAFLSRFWLDRMNTDLSEKIRQQKAILTSTQIFEREFRSFQKRLDAIDKSFERKYQPFDPVLIIAQSMPPDVLLSTYQFSEDKSGVTAKAKVQIFSEAGLADFINQLLNQEEVASVQIGTVEKKEGESGMSLDFVIRFNFSGEKNGKS